MSEKFLHPLPSPLREADPPRRDPWLYRYAWTLPVGLCFGFGFYSLTFGRLPATGLGFILAGVFITAVFGRIK